MFGGAALASVAAEERLTITAVRAALAPFRPATDFGLKEFRSDEDPARRRWFGPFSQLTGEILVRIDTESGVTGWGLGGGGSAAIHIIKNHLRDLLIGSDAMRVELLWHQMFDSSSLYGGRGLPVMAISGIDLALWDIIGKHRGRPVHKLLGGESRKRVPGYYTGLDPRKGLALGFEAYKIPIGAGLPEGPAGMDRTLARLREIRSIVGPKPKLMIDCLARWDVDYTLEFARRAEDLQLYFIEEPLYPYDVEGYETLCEKVRGTQIASGEHEYTRYGFRELIRHRAAHILQPDVTWSGGISECRRIVTMGAAAGLPVIPHRGGSPYGLALIAASKNAPLAESFGTGENDNELWRAFTSRFQDGYYYPSENPGFGLELSEKLLRRHLPELVG